MIRAAWHRPSFDVVYDPQHLGDAFWVLHPKEAPIESLVQGMETGLLGDLYLTGPFIDRNEAFMWAEESLS